MPLLKLTCHSCDRCDSAAYMSRIFQHGDSVAEEMMTDDCHKAYRRSPPTDRQLKLSNCHQRLASHHLTDSQPSDDLTKAMLMLNLR